MGQAAECTVGGGVGIATNNAHAGQCRALLWPDHMHDALALVLDLELQDAELVAVLIQGFHLNPRYRVNNAFNAPGTVGGGYVVIRRRQVGVQPPGLTSGQTKALEGLRRGDFVQQMPVDVNQRGAVIPLFDEMVVPQFVV